MYHKFLSQSSKSPKMDLYYKKQNANNEQKAKEIAKQKEDLRKLRYDTSNYVGNNRKLIAACLHGSLEDVKYFLTQDADIDCIIDIGGVSYTPLQAACQRKSKGHLDIVKFLLEEGAIPNLKNANGVEPLHEAAKYHNLAVIKLLLAKKVPINSKDKRGMTPLMYACEGSTFEENIGIKVARYLIDCGADVKLLDNYEQSALWHAIISSHNQQELVNYLIDDQKLDPNLGSSVLHAALTLIEFKKNIAIYEAYIEILLKAGANPAKINGQDLIEYAKENKLSDKIVNLLKQKTQSAQPQTTLETSPCYSTNDPAKHLRRAHTIFKHFKPDPIAACQNEQEKISLPSSFNFSQ